MRRIDKLRNKLELAQAKVRRLESKMLEESPKHQDEDRIHSTLESLYFGAGTVEKVRFSKKAPDACYFTLKQLPEFNFPIHIDEELGVVVITLEFSLDIIRNDYDGR